MGKKKSKLSVQRCNAALVTWTNEYGNQVEVPFINEDGSWVPLDTYFVYGLSTSDSGFPIGYALPNDWEPSEKITQLLRRKGG